MRAAITPGGAVFVLVVVLLAAVIWSNPNFGEPGFLIRFVGRTAPLAIAAIGQYYVIVSGEFDLSMGAVIATQVVMAGNLIGQDEGRILPVMALMIAVGALIGFLNGVATTLLKVPSFIVTLGMFLALGGLVKYLTGGAATGNPVDKFRQIGRGGIQDVPVVEVIPYSVIVLVVVAVLGALLMRSSYGRTLLAVGDNPEAASFAGTSVWWTKTWAFMISSLSATIAGILLVGYAGVHPSVGQGYEFQAITAVVLGGVVLGGGRGWVLSAAAGAFALELLLALLDLPRRRVDVAQHRAGHHHHPRRGRLGPGLDSRASPAISHRRRPIWKTHRNRGGPHCPATTTAGHRHRRTLMRRKSIRATTAVAGVLLLAVLTACSRDLRAQRG